jgi:hypothetical protein
VSINQIKSNQEAHSLGKASWMRSYEKTWAGVKVLTLRSVFHLHCLDLPLHYLHRQLSTAVSLLASYLRMVFICEEDSLLDVLELFLWVQNACRGISQCRGSQ